MYMYRLSPRSTGRSEKGGDLSSRDPGKQCWPGSRASLWRPAVFQGLGAEQKRQSPPFFAPSHELLRGEVLDAAVLEACMV